MKKHLIIIALLFTLLLTSCGNPGAAQESDPVEPSQSTAPAFDLNEYKSLVSEARSAMNEEGILLSNTGKYEANYWKSYASIGGDGVSDSMVDSAFEWLAENSEATRETVDANYEDIRQQYKNIILIDFEGREAEEIDAAFRSMYEAYDSMYSLVTSPSGTASSFSSELSDCISAFMDADEDLSLFLDQTGTR